MEDAGETMNIISVELASFDTVAHAAKTGGIIVSKKTPFKGTIEVAKLNRVVIVVGEVIVGGE